MSYPLIRAILFDCDGVLIDSESIANRALEKSLLEVGIHLSIIEIANTFTGLTFPACVEIIESKLGAAVPEDFAVKNRAYFREMMAKDLLVMPGVEAMLEQLHLPYALVTNSHREELSFKLTTTGLDRFFPPERRFDAQTMGVAKPDPSIYRQAAASIAHPIESCLIVEDSVPGLLAATRSGAQVWAYRPHASAAELHSLPIARIIENWPELLMFIQAD